MTPPPLEHDYIGLTDAGGGGRPGLNLKETELRLGLPGSESPGRKAPGLTLDLLPAKLAAVAASPTFVSGAKRGFSDAIDGSGKWAGSEVDIEKGGALFSPRGQGPAAGGGQAGAVVKDTAAAAAAAAAGKAAVGQDKKAQVPSGGDDRGGMAPAAKAQVVGWPPIRSYRKNTMATNPVKNKEDAEVKQGVGVLNPNALNRAQVVGWPPIRSYRKNTMATNPVTNKEDAEVKQGVGCLYVKVSMDGAPYLRKVDLKTYCNYKELSLSLEKMFSGFTIGQCGGNGIPGRDGLSESRLTDLLNGSEYVLTYEDRDGDWMLVGDVPWEMFTDSCRRLRIMKGSDAIGLAPRAMEKCKNQN